MQCPHCESTDLKFNSTRTTASGEPRYQYLCGGCGKYHTSPWELGFEEDVIDDYVRDDAWINQKLKKKTFVITSAQSNVDVNDVFLETLIKYCEDNDAELLVVPIKYSKTPGNKDHIFPEHIKDFLVENNFKLHDKVKVLGALKINAAAENPLTGLHAISKGDSVIVGHNQLQMTTLPINVDDLPVIMTSTGTVSDPEYSETKQGYKAGFNHAHSAVVVELDGHDYHIRHLNFDGRGFADLDRYFTPQTVASTEIEALVTGDEHAIFIDPAVRDATYTGKGNMCHVLRPGIIVRHDVLDCYSVSHHHRANIFTQFAKYQSGANRVQDELDTTINHVASTTPTGTKNLIIASNHNDHLTRWLNETDPKLEPWNAVIYHKLMYELLQNTRMGESGAEHPNPFELYSAPIFKRLLVDVEFIGRRQPYKIKDIEIANHGDVGANGSRGSRRQFSQLPSKTIIGHSHSPGIEKGCYQVGTSSYLKLEYSQGPSSWLNTHCIIHKNGKRQLVNIIHGKWRRGKK